MEFYNQPDDGKQKRAQSKDFGEIVNIQTNMNISDDRYDQIFHNWENPENCSGRHKNYIACSICQQLLDGKTVIRQRDKQIFPKSVSENNKNV